MHESARPQAAAEITSTLGGKPGDDHAYLVVVVDGVPGIFPLPPAGEVVIGRSRDADVRVDHASVSRRHARVVVAEGSAALADLGSHNGTVLNGETLDERPRPLRSGDLIAVGAVTLSYVARLGRGGAAPSVTPAELRARVDEELESGGGATVFYLAFGAAPGTVQREALGRAIAGGLGRVEVMAWEGDDRLAMLLPELPTDGDEALAPIVEVVGRLVPSVRAGFAVAPLDGSSGESLFAAARAAAERAASGRLAAAGPAGPSLRVGDRTVIVADPAMVRLFALLERLAPSDLPVLLWGETGAGKEIAATALHHWSRRRDRPLVALSCAALPDSLVESELFGYERGAFSGAVAAKPGLLESAAGGTLFLDEVGELPLPVQAKLLRVIEARRVLRLGATEEREIDVRLVAATNRNLEDEIAHGRFRRDLYFRLGAAPLGIPPLRVRQRELSLLARVFLDEACARLGRGRMSWTPAVERLLAAHAWPGNVRELRHLMDYLAATVADARVEPRHLPAGFAAPGPSATESLTGAPATVEEPTFVGAGAVRNIGDEVRQLERARMEAALAATEGNQTRAAHLLQVPLRTFVAKMKYHGIGGGRRTRRAE